jgi:hypothetical protein
MLNPKTIMNMFNILQENIRVSEFTLDEVSAGVKLFEEYKEKNGGSFSFVLDPSSGNMRLITSQNVVNTGAYAIGPIEGLGKYDNIQEYVTAIQKDPQLYSENPKIYVYNVGMGATAVNEIVSDMRKDFPYLNITYKGTLYSDKEGVALYLNSNDNHEYSFNTFVEYLKPDLTEKPDYLTTRLNGEDIVILFGKEKEDV